MKIPNFSHIYRIGLRFPVTVLILAALLTGLALFYARNLRIETDFTALLPPETESVRNLDTLKKYFGSQGYLYATVEAKDSALAESFADEFATRIEALPTIRYVDFRRPVEFFEKRKWLFVEKTDLEEMQWRVDRSLELEKEGVSPVFSDLMDFADEEDRPDLTFEDIKKKYQDRLGSGVEEYSSGEEGQFIILRAKAQMGFEDFDQNRALVASIRKIEGDLKQSKKYESIEVGYAGSYLTSIEGIDLIRKEMAWVSGLVFAALLLILVLYFRRISGAVLVGLPLFLGVVWTGGVIYFILGHINIITAFAASILAGLGSDYGIYLLSRFSQERNAGTDFLTSCQRAFGQTGKATFAAMVTTVGAFGSLIFSGFEAFVEFGIVGCIGLAFNFLAMMLVIPSLLQIGQRHPGRVLYNLFLGWTVKQGPSVSGASWSWKRIFAPKYAGVGIALTLLVCGISAFSLPTVSKIYFEDGQMDFQNLPSNKMYRRITDTVKSSLHPTVLLVKGADQERKTVEGFQRHLDESPEGSLAYEKVFGISTFIPKNQEEKRELIEKLGKKYKKARYVNKDQKRIFLDSVADVRNAESITQASLPNEVSRMFVSKNDEGVFAVYVFPALARLSSDEMNLYNNAIMQAKKDIGVEFLPIDGSFISMDIINMISGEAPRGLVLILLFFSAVLIITLRNFKRSLLILVNLLGGIVILSGILFLFGIKLNVLNIVVFPVILGTGIDCFIHFSHRYNETGELRDAIQKEVPAILVSNLTSIVGFGGLLFTSSVGLQSIGWVSVLGLIVVTFLCVFIFPRCLSILALGKLKVLKMDSKAAEA